MSLVKHLKFTDISECVSHFPAVESSRLIPSESESNFNIFNKATEQV